MGGKRTGTGEQILFYAAPLLILLLSGCALHDAQERAFSAQLRNGDAEQARKVLDGSDRIIDDKALFGYILLFSDGASPQYDPHMAQVYLDRITAIYPESPYTGYAAQAVRLMKRADSAERERAELNDKLLQVRKAMADQAAANAESLKALDEAEKRLAAENRELNDRLKALSRENEKLRSQQERMKEIDLNGGRKGLGH